MMTTVEIAFDPRSGSYSDMEFQVTDLLELYGGTVVACSVEC